MAVVLGAGASFGIGTAFGASPAIPTTALSQVRAITGPDIALGEVEITDLLSPNSFRVWAAGWGDAGEVTLDTMYDRAQYTTLLALIAGNSQVVSNRVFTVQNVNGDRLQFLGFLKNLGNVIELDNVITSPLTIRTSGKPQYFPGP